MISREQVQHIAKLARLGLTEKEIEKYQKELSSILDYFEKLKGVKVSGVEPTSHSIKVENVMRQDEAKESNKRLIELAPDKKDDYLKVKPILK